MNALLMRKKEDTRSVRKERKKGSHLIFTIKSPTKQAPLNSVYNGHQHCLKRTVYE